MAQRRTLSGMQGESGTIQGKGKGNCVFNNGKGRCLRNGECMEGPCGEYEPDTKENRARYLGIGREVIKTSGNMQIGGQKSDSSTISAVHKELSTPKITYLHLEYLGKRYSNGSKVYDKKHGSGKIKFFYQSKKKVVFVRVFYDKKLEVDYTWNMFCSHFGLATSGTPNIIK